MSTISIILDSLTVGIIVFFIVAGWRKGLIVALLGVGVTIVSLIAAWAIAMAFTPMVSNVIEDNIEPTVQQIIDAAKIGEDMLPDLSGITAPQVGEATKDALETLGFNGGNSAISGAITRRVNETGQSIRQATESTIYGVMAFAGLFIFSFILSRALLEFAIKFIADRLPLIHSFNRLGGAALGLVQGVLIMLILGWALQFTGRWISNENIEQTYVIKHFVNVGILNMLSGVMARVL